jgi:hypothetical protein
LSAAKLQVNAIQQPKPQEYHKINNNVNMTERMNECWIPNCYSCLAISWQWLWWGYNFFATATLLFPGTGCGRLQINVQQQQMDCYCF